MIRRTPPPTPPRRTVPPTPPRRTGSVGATPDGPPLRFPNPWPPPRVRHSWIGGASPDAALLGRVTAAAAALDFSAPAAMPDIDGWVVRDRRGLVKDTATGWLPDPGGEHLLVFDRDVTDDEEFSAFPADWPLRLVVEYGIPPERTGALRHPELRCPDPESFGPYRRSHTLVAALPVGGVDGDDLRRAVREYFRQVQSWPRAAPAGRES